MTELVHKRRRLTEEGKLKRKEKERQRQEVKSENERAWLKAHKPKKVPLTKEEKAERERIRLEIVEEKKLEFANKKIPMDRMEVMRRIRKIYSRGGIEELASDTGICEHWFTSWMETNQRPEGGYLKDLQEHFAKD